MVQRLRQGCAAAPTILRRIIFFHHAAVFFIAADQVNPAVKRGGCNFRASGRHGRAHFPTASEFLRADGARSEDNRERAQQRAY
jgi:hypothetical protein